jgi:hypothetical protein
MSTTGYAYAANHEFDTQVTNQKFIFIFGLKKNSGVKIHDSESNRYAKSLVISHWSLVIRNGQMTNDYLTKVVIVE